MSCLKTFNKVRVYYIYCFQITCKSNQIIIKSIKLCWAWFCFGKLILVAPDDLMTIFFTFLKIYSKRTYSMFFSRNWEGLSWLLTSWVLLLAFLKGKGFICLLYFYFLVYKGLSLCPCFFYVRCREGEGCSYENWWRIEEITVPTQQIV